MQKITLLPNETLEINGVQINAEFLKAVKNFQEQHQTRLLKGKVPDPYFSMFHPAQKPSQREVNESLLLVGNNLEYLERLKLNHEICLDGLESLIEIKDEFISLAADLRDVVTTNEFVEIRPGALEYMKTLKLDIAGLKLEIEDEKANPSDVSMAVRLYNRLGHL
jgi:hypothetical protein